MLLIVHFLTLLHSGTVFAVELCSLLHGESVPLQGFFITGDRLQLIISNQVYTTQMSIDSSGQHLNLIGGESLGSYQTFGWMAIAVSTIARTSVDLVAAFELPSDSNVSLGHLVIRQTGTQQLDHKLVDIDGQQNWNHRMKKVLPDGVYGLVKNAHKSLLFRARSYTERKKVVIFRQGPVISASGDSIHLPVKGNEVARKPFYYLQRDPSLNGSLQVTKRLAQRGTTLSVPSFSSLPLFGFIHQETAHVIDAATRTVILLPLSALDQSGSGSSGNLSEVKFEHYFVCASASIQGVQTTVLVVVIAVGVVLVAAVAFLSNGHHRREPENQTSNLSSSSISASDTNRRRLEAMVTKMGTSIKSRPCFNPAMYKVRGAKKKKKKKNVVKSSLKKLNWN